MFKVQQPFFNVSMLIIIMLFTSCKENPGGTSKSLQMTKEHNNLELRMSGNTSTQREFKPFLGSLLKELLSDNFNQTKDSLFVKDAGYAKTLDSIGTALSSRLFLESDPLRIVKELNKCFFEQMGMKVENRNSSLHNILPHLVLQSRKSNVLGGSIIMLLIAEKADLPLHGAFANDHFFVRFDNGKTHLNIELLRFGECMPDKWYSEKYGSKDGSADIKDLNISEMIGILYYTVGNVLYSTTKNNKIPTIINYASAMNYYKDFRKCQRQINYVIDQENDTGKMLKSLVELRSKNAELISLDRNIALLYLRQKNYTMSVDCYKRALERYPDDISLLKGAAISYVNLHDFSMAKKTLHKVISLEPNDSQAMALLQKCPK